MTGHPTYLFIIHPILRHVIFLLPSPFSMHLNTPTNTQQNNNHKNNTKPTTHHRLLLSDSQQWVLCTWAGLMPRLVFTGEHNWSIARDLYNRAVVVNMCIFRLTVRYDCIHFCMIVFVVVVVCIIVGVCRMVSRFPRRLVIIIMILQPPLIVRFMSVGGLFWVGGMAERHGCFIVEFQWILVEVIDRCVLYFRWNALPRSVLYQQVRKCGSRVVVSVDERLNLE